MRTIHLKGPGLNDFFAEQLVKDYGAEIARDRTCGPARAAVERVVKRLDDEAKEHAAEVAMVSAA